MKRAGPGGAGPKAAGGPNKAKIYARPEAIASGEVFIDAFNKGWKLGKSIGSGGFGDIYLASDDTSKAVSDKTAGYVMKIEPYMNGPLFVENSFYIRNAKLELIEQWRTDRKIESLGMPHFVASGRHEYHSQWYRFMVLPRYGQDLHKIIESKPGKRLSCRAVQAIALQVLDVLEFIHSREYIHADIKASNLLLGLGKKEQLFLVDYGLAARFSENGKHQDYSPDNRKAHNGTLEYTSRDAHIGVYTRRGDLEILGYNMMEWLCGKLPWSNTDPPALVHKQKVAFMNNIQLKKLYSSDIQGLDILEGYLKFVTDLTYDQQPNYNQCRQILKQDLPSKLAGLYLNDSISSPKKKRASASSKARTNSVEEFEVVPKKIKVPDDDLASKKRATRTTKKVTKKFNWTNVLASNPEMIIRSASQTAVGSHSPPDLKPTLQISGTLTPAMMQILEKKKENVFQSPFKSKPQGQHSPDHFPEGTSHLTPAMQEILRKTKKKKLRKSLSMNVLPTESDTQQNHHSKIKHSKTTDMIPKTSNLIPIGPKPVARPPIISSIPILPAPLAQPAIPSLPIATAPVSTRQARYNRRNFN